MFQIRNNHFIDSSGRVALLRGVNLSGSTKVPCIPAGATWNPAGFQDAVNVSFVGRPFPLAEADEHFSRLRAWGLTFLRFLVTWEAIEHAGPGLYDEAYLDYLYAVVKKAADHDICLFIDPHQDCWSRFTGGDGAPGWIFDLLGLDRTKFHAAGAAFNHQDCGDPLPKMIWTSNYGKYAAATLFTLFFGGNTFAPQTTIQGVPIQEFLQGHYIAAIQQVAERLREFPHVLGYDTLNEPSQGFIGFPDANQIPFEFASYGALPTIYQSLLLAAGYPQTVKYKPNKLPLPSSQTVVVNSAGLRLYREGVTPIWQQNGVWDVDAAGNPQLLQPDYFGQVAGQPVNFDQQFFAPFVRRYTAAIRSIHPDALIFVSPPPAEMRIGAEGFALSDEAGLVFAPHWYDGITLSFQKYLSWLGVDTAHQPVRLALGRKNRRRFIARQLGAHLERARRDLGEAPVVIGETGIPFNLEHGRAFRTGDFSAHVQALDDTIQGLEANFLNFTLWNYTPDNTNARGDLWNDEDLSIFSRDQQTGSGDINDGGRALPAAIRPYAARVPGEPLTTRFDLPSREFQFTFRLNPAVTAPLEVFLPRYHYPNGAAIQVTRGRVQVDLLNQRLEYWPDAAESIHTLTLRAA